MPMLDNDTGRALDNFISVFESRLHDRYGTEFMSKEQIREERA
jgi:hypothetical protein